MTAIRPNSCCKKTQVKKSVKHYPQARHQTGDYYLYTVKYVLLALLLYIAYQFIFKLVIPVYRTTKQVKQKFREMHSRMEEEQKQQQGYTPGYAEPKSGKKEKIGDYIDFEEVK